MAKAKRTRKKKEDGKKAGGEAPINGAGEETAGETPSPGAEEKKKIGKTTVKVSSRPDGVAVAVPSIEGVPITPLNPAEAELIATFEGLDYASLRDMAAERRWQEEIIREAIESGEEIREWNEHNWYERLKTDMIWNDVPEEAQKIRITAELSRLIKEAEALEKESDRRQPPVREFMFPGEGRKPTPVERADTLIGSPVAEVGTETKTVVPSGGINLIRHEMQTVDLPSEGDFSTYGDIFYEVERVFLEGGEKYESGKPEEFWGKLEKAIVLAEGIASKTEGGEGAGPEMERAEKLRNFRKEFFEMPEGKERPEKDFDGYRLWLERKREEFKDAEDAFEILGILPWEYNRKELLGICDSALRGRNLKPEQQREVLALIRMLEIKKIDGETDNAAAQTNADLAYGLAMAFARRKYNGLQEARIAEILRLEEQLKGKKFESAAHRDKMLQMAGILSQVHTINRIGEETTGKVTRDVNDQLGRIREDYEKREMLIRSLFTALAGEGEAGSRLMEKAEQDALANLGARNVDTGRRRAIEESVPKQQGHAPKGIGIAIGAAVGAAVFAAGMFASQYLGGSRAENEAQMPAVVQVEGPVEKTAESVPKDVPAIVPEKKDAGVSDAGADALASAGDAGAEEALASDEYSRDKEGLKKALDEWCLEERGLLVSGGMLRAAYATIEEKLDGSVLPKDVAWVPLMLEMKFPNRLVELAIMSDVARSELEYGEKYATLMRLSIPLGERAKTAKGFPEMIEAANAKGMNLPEIGKDSYLGKIEAAKTGRACLAAAYFGRVAEMMDEVKKGATESGMDKKQFKKALREALGEHAKEVEKEYRLAKYWATMEKNTPNCKLLSGGKNGFDALSRTYTLSKRWIKNAEKKKKRQEEIDDILGEVPKKVKTGGKPAKPAALPCAGMQGADYLSCVNKQNAAKKDTGEKKMQKPKEAGTVSKSPKMLLRY